MKTIQNQPQNEWQTPGQPGAKHLLNNFVNGAELGEIPHAFIFLGPQGVGKTSLALEFAKKISNSQLNRAEIFEFDFAESGNVSQLRELISFSSLTTEGSRKIFVLKNFEQATIASSNALLKTLEEPVDNTVFLLIANSNRVLPTVMSRCVTIRCFPVEGAVSTASLPKELLIAVEHYPGLAQQLLDQPDLANSLSEFLKKLVNHKTSLVDISQLAELDQNDLQLLIMLWINNLKTELASHNASLPNVIHNLKVAQNLYEDLQRSYNSKLVLQQFLMNTI